jgi:hypothetical protein
MVSHAEFDQAPNRFRPRGEVGLRLPPQIDCLEQIRLKACANQHAGGPRARFLLGFLECFHVIMIPRK